MCVQCVTYIVLIRVSVQFSTFAFISWSKIGRKAFDVFPFFNNLTCNRSLNNRNFIALCNLYDVFTYFFGNLHATLYASLWVVANLAVLVVGVFLTFTERGNNNNIVMLFIRFQLSGKNYNPLCGDEDDKY